MRGEAAELGVEFRVIPVGLEHPRLQVVHHHGFGHAAIMPEAVFQTAQERLGVLAADGLGVALARMAQHAPEDVGAPPLALELHPGPQAKVHLHLLPGGALHPPERQRRARLQPAHETLHRVVPAGETMVSHQILMDAPG